jgi:hypothetical protein
MKLNHLNEKKKKKKKKLSAAFLAIVYFSVASTPSTKRTYTQLKEEPCHVQTGPTTNKKKEEGHCELGLVLCVCARQWLTLCFDSLGCRLVLG